MWRSISTLIVAAGLLGAAATPAEGQVDTRSSRQPEGWRYFDYFVTRYGVDGTTGGQKELDGVGGRVMWQLAPLVGGSRQGWMGRTLLGGYLVHTSRDAEEMEVWRYGTQADLRVTPPALPRWIDPFVSLGVGAVRVEEEGRVAVPGVLLRASPNDVPGAYRRAPLERTGGDGRPATSLSVTPGVGARLRLFPGLDLRGDARQVLDFRSRMRSHLEVAGGLSLYL